MDMDQNGEIIVVKNEENPYARSSRAAYVKGRSTLYLLRGNDSLVMPDMKSVHAGTFVQELLLKLASDDLDEHIRTHIDDVSMYGSEDYWKEGLFYIGRVIPPGEILVMPNKITDGYLPVYLGGQDYDNPLRCYYDIREERLRLEYKDQKDNTEKPAPTSFSDYVYGKAKRYALSMAQFGEGIIPAPYMELYLEISKINGFLEGKRTVRADFGRGKKLLCYPRQLQTAAFLIKMENGSFVTYSYNYRPYEKDGKVVYTAKREKLPRRLFQRNDEILIDTEAFEQVSFTPSDPIEKQKHDYKQKLQEIEALIPGDARYAFTRIKIQCGGYGHDELYVCSGCETLEQLLQMPQVEALVTKRCAGGTISIKAQTYTIGSGSGDAPLPEKVFKMMQTLGNPWLYRNMNGYSEQPEREYLLDGPFLYRYMGAGREDCKLSYTVRESLTRNMLFASLPADTSYEYCVLQISGGGPPWNLEAPGHIRSECDLLKIQALRSALEELDEDGELMIMADNLRLGNGFRCERLPEEMIAVMKPFDAETFATRDRSPSFSYDRKYYLDKSMLG